MVVVGHTRKRVGRDGAVRYTAYYDDVRGRRRSAGTFSTRKAASIAWQEAELAQRAGHPGSTDAGKIRFADYVNEIWFPNHVLEPSTRESYRYCIDRHIIPWFGSMKMRDILPVHVREWVTQLSAAGVRRLLGSHEGRHDRLVRGASRRPGSTPLSPLLPAGLRRQRR